MKLRDIGEFGLIERIDAWITRGQRSLPSQLKIDIGDDAAAWKSRPGYWTVATVDTLVEGTHFTRKFSSWEDIGWKAMAVNISDIAAMGARPRWALVAVTLADRLSVEDVRAMYRGLIACGRQFGTRITGGNISRGPAVTISVTVVGEAKAAMVLKRDGARVGDIIAVTGDLGAAAAGLAALKKQVKAPTIVRRYQKPVPRMEWLRRLQRARVSIHAAIDLSDGLGNDLAHICAASGTGARIDLDVLPISNQTTLLSRVLRKPLTEWAVNGGEDYELLFTMTDKEFKKAKKVLGRYITKIGIMTASRGMQFYAAGRRVRFRPSGYRHF